MVRKDAFAVITDSSVSELAVNGPDVLSGTLMSKFKKFKT
jgi:hypothetical protein